jgi:hypothetical protein
MVLTCLLTVSIALAHDYQRGFTITVEQPTSSEDITIWQVGDIGITITKIVCVIQGTATSLDIDPRHSTDRSAAGTPILEVPETVSSESGGDTFLIFDDPSIEPNSFVWFETSNESGDLLEISCSFYYLDY